MREATLRRRLLGVEKTVVESVEFEEEFDGAPRPQQQRVVIGKDHRLLRAVLAENGLRLTPPFGLEKNRSYGDGVVTGCGTIDGR